MCLCWFSPMSASNRASSRVFAVSSHGRRTTGRLGVALPVPAEKALATAVVAAAEVAAPASPCTPAAPVAADMAAVHLAM
jgi:hypothetical protein